MKKSLLVTLVIFIISLALLMLKWEVLVENDFGNNVFVVLTIVFLIFMVALIEEYVLISIIVIILLAIGLFFIIKKTNKELLSVIATFMLGFFAFINFVLVLIYLTTPSEGTAIIKSFGGQDEMLQTFENLLIQNNEDINFTFIENSLEKDYISEETRQPKLSYEFEISFEENGDTYKGQLDISIICENEGVENCYILNKEFIDVKNESGVEYIPTENEDIEDVEIIDLSLLSDEEMEELNSTVIPDWKIK